MCNLYCMQAVPPDVGTDASVGHEAIEGLYLWVWWQLKKEMMPLLVIALE